MCPGLAFGLSRHLMGRCHRAHAVASMEWLDDRAGASDLELALGDTAAWQLSTSRCPMSDPGSALMMNGLREPRVPSIFSHANGSRTAARPRPESNHPMPTDTRTKLGQRPYPGFALQPTSLARMIV